MPAYEPARDETRPGPASFVRPRLPQMLEALTP
jgi:hypothetical protein